MKRASILLADDHTILIEGLVSLLKDRFDVVGTVADGQELLATAQRVRADVIVTDVNMPGMNGLEALERLKDAGVTSRVIVLTMHAEPEIAAKAMRAGAAGFVLKHAAGEELIAAIEQVLNGRKYLTPAITKGVLNALVHPTKDRPPELTRRQREVLRLMMEGKRMKEIAAVLNLSTRTVESHRYEMMRTLGVETTAELVGVAIRTGLA